MNKCLSYLLGLLVLMILVARVYPQAPLSIKYLDDSGLQRTDLPSFLDASKKIPGSSVEVGAAIIAAGKTNDPFWIAYVKPFLRYSRDRNSNLSALAGDAQLALARLGEREQLQEIGCEANFGSSSIQYDAVKEKLKYVQGWFSISILAKSMDASAEQTQLLVDRPGDEIFEGPRDLALVVLPEIVPNPPSLAPPLPIFIETQDQEKLAALRQGWREWINKNEGSLRKLTPLGDGLDLSRSTCKRVLARDRHFDRSNLK
jgi:hypothetical protein